MDDETSHESDAEDDEEYSSDEDDEVPTKYINASHVDVKKNLYIQSWTFSVKQTSWCIISAFRDTGAQLAWLLRRDPCLTQSLTSSTCFTRRRWRVCSCFLSALRTAWWVSSMGSWFVMQESERCHFHDVPFLSMCQEFCSQYWDDEKKTFGELLVEVKETENTPTYVRRCIEIQHTKVFRSFLITLSFITAACISIQCSCLGMKDNSHACMHSDSFILSAEERQPRSATVPLPEMGGSWASGKPPRPGWHDEECQEERR